MTGDPEHIRGWQRLDDRVTTSGRIEARDISRLSALGVSHVINLAMADHPDALLDEADMLRLEAIAYTHIPVPFDAPTDQHYEHFRDALGHATGNVHVHCIMNWRVSAFFYRLHRERGMAEAEARGLMAVHWEPETNPHPDAPTWARFIAGGA